MTYRDCLFPDMHNVLQPLRRPTTLVALFYPLPRLDSTQNANVAVSVPAHYESYRTVRTCIVCTVRCARPVVCGHAVQASCKTSSSALFNLLIRCPPPSLCSICPFALVRPSRPPSQSPRNAPEPAPHLAIRPPHRSRQRQLQTNYRPTTAQLQPTAASYGLAPPLVAVLPVITDELSPAPSGLSKNRSRLGQAQQCCAMPQLWLDMLRTYNPPALVSYPVLEGG